MAPSKLALRRSALYRSFCGHTKANSTPGPTEAQHGQVLTGAGGQPASLRAFSAGVGGFKRPPLLGSLLFMTRMGDDNHDGAAVALCPVFFTWNGR